MKYTKENLEKRRKRFELSRTIFVTIIYIILIPVIFYNIMIIFQAAVNSEETPSVFGIKSFVIISGSMEPNLKIGDIIIIKHISDNELKEGDIVSFRNGTSIITHRINSIIVDETGTTKYETKGDNNNISDKSLIKYSDIEGIVVGKIPYLGNLVLLLKNKVVIIFILLLFYIMYIHNINVEQKKTDEKRKKKNFKRKI